MAGRQHRGGEYRDPSRENVMACSSVSQWVLAAFSGVIV